MPLASIQDAIVALQARQDKAGPRAGAAQFDVVAVTTLACLGMRPQELFSARSTSLVEKKDVFGKAVLYFRISDGKNKSSERDIPLSDGERSIVVIEELQKLLAWLDANLCDSFVASACACAVAAMNAISESRTAICTGSLVLPSKTIALMTVLITTPRCMNSLMLSVICFSLFGTHVMGFAGVPEPSQDATDMQHVRYLGQKGLIVFFLFFGVLWAARNYGAARHNYVVNKHRANALGSFQAFAASATDEQTKSAVLVQATQSVFLPQASGYVKNDGDNTASSPIIEILRSVGGKEK